MRKCLGRHDSFVATAGFFSLESDVAGLLSLVAGELSPELFSDPSEEDLAGDFLASRLSLTYQPEPLKTMPTGCGTRRIGPPHSGHSVKGSSANFWKKSNECPQSEQR